MMLAEDWQAEDLSSELVHPQCLKGKELQLQCLQIRWELAFEGIF